MTDCWSATAGLPDCRPVVPLPADPAGDGHDDERIIISQWLNANSERVRIVEVRTRPGDVHAIRPHPESCRAGRQRGYPEIDRRVRFGSLTPRPMSRLDPA